MYTRRWGGKLVGIKPSKWFWEASKQTDKLPLWSGDLHVGLLSLWAWSKYTGCSESQSACWDLSHPPLPVLWDSVWNWPLLPPPSELPQNWPLWPIRITNIVQLKPMKCFQVQFLESKFYIEKWITFLVFCQVWQKISKCSLAWIRKNFSIKKVI